MADPTTNPKLLGDYLEELINGWCPHSTEKGIVQALSCPRCVGDALKEVQDQTRLEMLTAIRNVIKDMRKGAEVCWTKEHHSLCQCGPSLCAFADILEKRVAALN